MMTFSPETLARFDREVAKFPPDQKPSAVMACLAIVQHEQGHVSTEAEDAISKSPTGQFESQSSNDDFPPTPTKSNSASTRPQSRGKNSLRSSLFGRRTSLAPDTFAPAANMSPAWLRTIAEWNPISSLVRAIRELWGNAAPLAQIHHCARDN